MKRAIATLIAAALAALVFGAYRIGVERGRSVAVAPGAPSAASSAERIDPATGRKVLYWHDPMVPGQKFDKPGKSPFMDMALVPVYADGDSDTGGVTISPRLQQNLGVRTAEVTSGRLAPKFEVAGTVAYNERDVAVVSARVNGYVEKLYVRAPLDPVRKGQALAEIYAPEWVAAQEEYLSVKRMQAAGTEALVAAARQRMLLAGMSEEQVRAVESGGKVQARFTLTAPIGGVIAELGAREGMTAMAGNMLFRINGLGTVWIYAEVPESAAAHVLPGAAVEARTAASPERVFRGRVAALLPEVNATTRTLKARIEVANSGGVLTPGMFAIVNFAPTAKSEVLLVPSEAVIQTGRRAVVIADAGGGKFQPVEVETGTEANGQTEIRKGLALGQKVVVSGQFLIDSEASLKATTARMSDSPPEKGADAKVHRGEGRIEAIAKDAVTLSHEPIASLGWGAMTMEFVPPAAGLPRNVHSGDRVTFEFLLRADGTAELTKVGPATATVNGSHK